MSVLITFWYKRLGNYGEFKYAVADSEMAWIREVEPYRHKEEEYVLVNSLPITDAEAKYARDYLE